MTKQVTNIVTTQKDTAKLTLTKTEIKSGILDYAILLKPRVMSLVLFTSVVGIVMAPGTIDLFTAVAAIICIDRWWLQVLSFLFALAVIGANSYYHVNFLLFG